MSSVVRLNLPKQTLWRSVASRPNFSSCFNHRAFHSALFRSDLFPRACPRLNKISLQSSPRFSCYANGLKPSWTVNTSISRGTHLPRGIRVSATLDGIEIGKLGTREALGVRVGCSTGPMFSSSAIGRTWIWSKELCPSGHNVPRTPGNLLTSPLHSSACQTARRSNPCDGDDGGYDPCGDPCKDPCSDSRKRSDPCSDMPTNEDLQDDPCAPRREEVRECIGQTSSYDRSGGDSCEKPCPPYICKIPRLVCPAPTIQELYPSASHKTVVLWRMIFLGVALPILLIGGFFILKNASEERKKPRPPFIDAPYLHIRTKAYPWGDGMHSFFHNPAKNGIPPHGYEVPDPNAVEESDTPNK